MRALKVGVVIAVFLAGGCGGGGGPIAGFYYCNPAAGFFELREDGTVTFTSQGAAPFPSGDGTWSFDGSSGTFDVGTTQDPFTVRGETIRFSPAGSPEALRCILQA